MILPTDPGWDGFGMRGRVLTTDVILIFAFFEKKFILFFQLSRKRSDVAFKDNRVATTSRSTGRNTKYC
jgi:hypothetical protein